MSPITVLMVAEKPSLAASIAEILASGAPLDSRGGSLAVHEWQGTFRGQPALFRMTSVIGHVYSLDFTNAYQSWETDPIALFGAATIKSEANPKAHVCRHLQSEARGMSFPICCGDARPRLDATHLSSTAVGTI